MKIVDTTVCVDHLRGHDAARSLMESLLNEEDPVVGSELTRYELLAGTRPRDAEAVERLLTALEWAPVTEDVTREAALLSRRYRRSHAAIDDIDYLIAATAMVLEAELLTTNVRHFPMFHRLKSPYPS